MWSLTEKRHGTLVHFDLCPGIGFEAVEEIMLSFVL